MEMGVDKDIILCLYDKTGTFAAPWVAAGYKAILVDIQHTPTVGFVDGYWKLNLDLRDGLTLPESIKQRLAFVAAFPPCDHLAVSGARWFVGKGLRKLSLAISLFATAAEVCEEAGVPYFIENPVSTISTYWRKPDYTFDPYWFTRYAPDDNYTKKTCLWVGGGFVMPQRAMLEGLSAPDNRIHFCSPGPERANIRSVTPAGFSQAVFECNRPRS